MSGADHDASVPEPVPADAIYASEAEGDRYRSTAFVPTPYSELEIAPVTGSFPDPGQEAAERYRTLDLPKVPKLKHVLGPSAIMLGASLGSGETLFWPFIVSEHGWVLYWAFLVGVITQFFINTEIQRWTLATGESVFRAFERVGRVWPWFFLLAGFVSLGWPGWAASAAQVAAVGLGVGEGTVTIAGVVLPAWKILSIALLLAIYASYNLSSVMYRVVETGQTMLVILAVLLTLVLVAVVGSYSGHLAAPEANALAGSVPAGMDLAVLLGALAYAGAGGYLNLSQSLWVREKGYGMSIFQGRVRNPFMGEKPEPVHRSGFTFPPSSQNLERWRAWWRLAQLEHFLTFVLGLLLVATAMMTVPGPFDVSGATGAVTMWLEGIVPQLGDVGRVLVYLVLFISLFTTEYAIVESFVRNSSDIVYEAFGRAAGWNLSTVFYGLLTLFIGWGILIIALPFEHPFGLLVRAAAMSGIMMWPYNALTLIVNTTRLPEHLQPGWVRVAVMWWATGFFGFFSTLLIGDTLVGLGLPAFAVGLDGGPIGAGGFALWALFLAVQAVTVVVSTRAKLAAAGTVPGSERVRGLFH